MRKSPFSTPRGSGHPNYGWKSGGNSGGGYARVKNFAVYTPNLSDNSSSRSSGDDFIPLSPGQAFPNDRRSGGSWSSPGGNWQTPKRGNYRNWASPPAASGFNNYRKNSPWKNNRASPRYGNGGNPYRGNHTNFQRGNGRGKADLSHYVNLKWFLEDPWAALTQRLKARVDVTGGTDEAASNLTFDDSPRSDRAEGTRSAGRETVRASPARSLDPEKSRGSAD